jgi:hypothetical protein
MPLRDHFRPPISKRASWEGFHGLWPGTMVLQLGSRLPSGYVAEPRVHLGSVVEVDAEMPEQYAYEVLIHDVERDRTLVAVVEIVSPANKDRAESRQLFVAKCASLLQKGVCLSIVDLATVHNFNLYTDLLASYELSGQFFSPPPPTYAVTCRKRAIARKTRREIWPHTLVVGQPLPTLPIWLTENDAVSLDLESCYEETCRALRIP